LVKARFIGSALVPDSVNTIVCFDESDEKTGFMLLFISLAQPVIHTTIDTPNATKPANCRNDYKILRSENR